MEAEACTKSGMLCTRRHHERVVYWQAHLKIAHVQVDARLLRQLALRARDRQPRRHRAGAACVHATDWSERRASAQAGALFCSIERAYPFPQFVPCLRGKAAREQLHS